MGENFYSIFNSKFRMERDEYGYIDQKGSRYFIKVEEYMNSVSGFKNKKQVEEWLEGEFRNHGLDWRVGYAWKYRDNTKIFELINSKGDLIKI